MDKLVDHQTTIELRIVVAKPMSRTDMERKLPVYGCYKGESMVSKSCRTQTTLAGLRVDAKSAGPAGAALR
jgi:hypothetical protein